LSAVLRVFVEISLNHLNSDNLRQLGVQTRPVSVLEGSSVVIMANNLDISPLKQAIRDVVSRTLAKDLDLFFEVKEKPVYGVLQVTNAYVCYTVKYHIFRFEFSNTQ